jgi:formylglycine-generating enzyme required for sulfatase activity
LRNKIYLDMVSIRGGNFSMGSPALEKERSNDESPHHQVTVQPFWMGRYPITQAQWRTVAQFPKLKRSMNPDPSYFKGDNRPVEQISWLDAVEFCKRLSKKTGKEYRLPSEAEWEYACRAGTTTPFHFGSTITPELANYDGNDVYDKGSKGKYVKATTPVGSYKVANAFGLYDMHGNVWEWCTDRWHENYQGAPTDGSARPESREEKYLLRAYLNDLECVVRGGSWFYDPGSCRSASRNGLARLGVLNHVGFRVCCSSPRSS